jgi:hypothetical protein
MTVRIVPLGSEEAADARVPGTAAERVALLAELSRQMWELSRRPMPAYARSAMPVRFVTLNEQ